MPTPVPMQLRRQIVERHTQGESLVAISEALHLSYNTVKKLWRHWVQHQQLAPNYAQAKQLGTRRYPHVYAMALRLKRDHRKWGAVLIQVKLREQQLPEGIPSKRTLQRWFRDAGLGNSPKVRTKQIGPVKRGQAAHEVWAVDAKEQIALADGTRVSWLTVTDEGSGAVLDATVFPPASMGTGDTADRPTAPATAV